jgi:hypothetical protein
MRDMLIMQDALDWREAGEPDSDDPLDSRGRHFCLQPFSTDRFRIASGSATQKSK